LIDRGEWNKYLNISEVFYGENYEYEDFGLNGTSSVTALNFINGDTITYSRLYDWYEFRVIKKINGRWSLY
jgi:hypothetical protein